MKTVMYVGIFVALLVLTSQAAATTTSGFDTANGLDLIFAVEGTQTGDWSTAQLSVIGGIRLRYDGTPCSSAYEGSLRYNVSIHNFEFCNGSAWMAIGQTDPSGEVAYFYQPSCPPGWQAADGTNGTVDMRAEFPRGLDNGRGVEPGRSLGSWEDATGIGQTVFQAAFVSYWNEDAEQYFGGNVSRAGLDGYTTPQVMFKIRPRNVALLACSKI